MARSMLVATALAMLVACRDDDEFPMIDAPRADAGLVDAAAPMVDAATVDADVDADVDAGIDAPDDAADLDGPIDAPIDTADLDGPVDAPVDAPIDGADIDARSIDAPPTDAVLDARIDATIDATPIDAPGDTDHDGVTDDLDCAATDPARFTYRVTYADIDGDGVGAGPRAIECLGTTLPPGRRLGGYDDDDGDPLVIENDDSEYELFDIVLD